MLCYKFTPDRKVNLDETGVNIVLPTLKVLGEKKQRQVGQIVSAEREELVTSDSDSSESELLKLSDDNNNEESDEGDEKFDIPNPENINIIDFFLIKFEKKKSVVHYVAKVISK
ncbi:hypothetical protein RN001_010712 [Aquatica leii]|uniref:Uncharacterized protein n=1 Tax=Aquatica leii TaxID=1421715 RepID=A0AAN7S8N8_9COLE|nr:hypothetical protein RN001_010712 [Aquatica leii]